MNCRDPGWPVEVARRQRSAHSRNSRKLATEVLSKSVPAHAPFKISEVSHQFPDLVSTTSKTFSSSEFVRKSRCFDVERKLHNEQLTVERRRASVARAEERAATTALQFFPKGTITNLNISCQSLRYFDASSKNRRCFWDASATMLNAQGVFDLQKGKAVEWTATSLLTYFCETILPGLERSEAVSRLHELFTVSHVKTIAEYTLQAFEFEVSFAAAHKNDYRGDGGENERYILAHHFNASTHMSLSGGSGIFVEMTSYPDDILDLAPTVAWPVPHNAVLHYVLQTGHFGGFLPRKLFDLSSNDPFPAPSQKLLNLVKVCQKDGTQLALPLFALQNFQGGGSAVPSPFNPCDGSISAEAAVSGGDGRGGMLATTPAALSGLLREETAQPGDDDRTIAQRLSRGPRSSLVAPAKDASQRARLEGRMHPSVATRDVPISQRLPARQGTRRSTDLPGANRGPTGAHGLTNPGTKRKLLPEHGAGLLFWADALPAKVLRLATVGALKRVLPHNGKNSKEDSASVYFSDSEGFYHLFKLRVVRESAPAEVTARALELFAIFPGGSSGKEEREEAQRQMNRTRMALKAAKKSAAERAVTQRADRDRKALKAVTMSSAERLKKNRTRRQSQSKVAHTKRTGECVKERGHRSSTAQALKARAEQDTKLDAVVSECQLGEVTDAVRAALVIANEATGFRLSEPGEDVVNDPDNAKHQATLEKHLHQNIQPSELEIAEMNHIFIDKLTFKRNLYACATCGIRELAVKDYKDHPLSSLKNTCFEYDGDAHKNLAALDVDVTLHREDGTTFVKNLQCIRAYHMHENVHYHVHRHLVSGTRDGGVGEPCVRLCVCCAKAAEDTFPFTAKIPPPFSLPAMDFGSFAALSLPKPTVIEQCFLSPYRLYGYILKVLVVSNRTERSKIDVSRSKLSGSFIMFPHVGPVLASDAITDALARDVCSRLKLWLVGPDDKLDVLAKRALNLPELALRSPVVHSYMTVKYAIDQALNHPNDRTAPKPPSLELIDEARNTIREALLRDARLVDETSVEAVVDRKMAPSDIGRARSVNPGDLEAEVNGDCDEPMETVGNVLGADGGGQAQREIDDAHFSMIGVLSAPQDGENTIAAALQAIKETCSKGDEVDNATAYDGGAPTVAESLDERPPLPPPAALKVARGSKPVSEYDTYGTTLMEHFWYLFPLRKGLPQNGHCKKAHRNLMLHHSNTFSSSTTLMLLLVNVLQRHAVNRAVGLRVVNSPAAFAAFADLVSDAGFVELLEQAIKNPKGKEALQVFSKVLPFISISGKCVPWGSLERSSLVGDLLALGRRHGPGVNFFSAAPHDTHNATTLRFLMHTVGNESFPALSDPAFLKALQQQKLHEFLADHPGAAEHIFDIEIPARDAALERAAAQNPVATSAVFLELVDVLMEFLFGVAPSKTGGGKASRITRPFDQWNKGVLGKLSAWMYVIETSGRKALHIHALLFGGLSPRLLACLLGRPELHTMLLRALDSHYKSSVPWQVHAVDCARRTLNLPPVRPTFHQPNKHDWKDNLEKTRLATQFDALTVGLHKTKPHAPTCTHGKSGQFGCRMTKPSAHSSELTRFLQIVLKPDPVAESEIISYKCLQGCPTNADAVPGEKCNFRVIEAKPLPPSAALWPRQGAEDHDESDVASSDEDAGNGEEAEPGHTARLRRHPGTSRLLPNRDQRCLAMELGRPSVHMQCLPPPDPEPTPKMRLRVLLRRAMWVNQARTAASGAKGDAAAAATAARLAAEDRLCEGLMRQARAVEMVHSMCEHPKVKAALQSPDGVPMELEQCLHDIDGPTAVRLLARWRDVDFKCRNALLVEYNELITSLLGCNTAPLPMGCSEGAKSAMFYMIKYVTKDSVAVQQSLSILVDAKRHMEQYPSTADDTGQVERTGRHFVQRCLNQLQQEISDTQAAVCLRNTCNQNP